MNVSIETLENQVKSLKEELYKGENVAEYWFQRCRLAEAYINKSPCDPDYSRVEFDLRRNLYLERINDL
jgi:hypothetical protein